MWLFTQHGFYSIVQKDDGFFHIRARVRSDLENLLQLVDLKLTIHEWSTADYRYRLLVDLETLLEVIVHLATSLDYSNFKGRIPQREDQCERLGVYHKVWATLADGLSNNE